MYTQCVLHTVMGTDPFSLDRRSRSYSYSLMQSFSRSRTSLRYPIPILSFLPDPITILFIYLINTILFHYSKQYIYIYM